MSATEYPYFFLFGASSDAPHQQYVINLEGSPINRYFPWKFRTEKEAKDFVLVRGCFNVKVPGYQIYLVAERLSKAHKRFITIVGDHEFWANSAEAEEAAQFYLKHKILPNAEKFKRYKDATDR